MGTYKRPFFCPKCLKNRWPGDCEHGRPALVMGPAEVLPAVPVASVAPAAPAPPPDSFLASRNVASVRYPTSAAPVLPERGTVYADSLDEDNRKRWKVDGGYVNSEGNGIVRMLMSPGGAGHVTLADWGSFLATHKVAPERGCFEPGCEAWGLDVAPGWGCPRHNVAKELAAGALSDEELLRMARGGRPPAPGVLVERRQDYPNRTPRPGELVVSLRKGRHFKVDRVSVSGPHVGATTHVTIVELASSRERADWTLDVFRKEFSLLVPLGHLGEAFATRACEASNCIEVCENAGPGWRCRIHFAPVNPLHLSAIYGKFARPKPFARLMSLIGQMGTQGDAFETYAKLCDSLSEEQRRLLDELCRGYNRVLVPRLRRRWPIGFRMEVVPAGSTANITVRPQLPMTIRRLACTPGLEKDFLILDIKVGRNSLFADHHSILPGSFPADRPIAPENLLVKSDPPDWENLPAEFVGPCTDVTLTVQNISPCTQVFAATVWGDVGPLDLPPIEPIAGDCEVCGASPGKPSGLCHDDGDGEEADDYDPRTTEEIMEPVDLFDRMLASAPVPEERTCPHGCREKTDHHPSGCEPGCYYCSSRKIRPKE